MMLDIIRWQCLLIPVAIMKLGRKKNGNVVMFRSLHIFGIRVAYWTITE